MQSMEFQLMTLKRFTAWFALVPASLYAAVATAQNITTSTSDASGSQANSNLPDACKLLSQADLEARFPGRPITSNGPTLSPVYKGPQYSQRCMYTIKLPSPTSKSDVTNIASVNIINWGGETDGRNGSAATFASIRSTTEKLDPALNIRIEPVPNIGDEAFAKITRSEITVYVRKVDLIYTVGLNIYSPQSQPNIVALAAQVAKRWKAGVGMVDAATPIAANGSVDIPDDTRASSTAPADQWPDACALLTAEDMHAVFGDMKISPPHKTMAEITHMSRIDRVEKLPKPIDCLYQTSRTDLVDGQRRIVSHLVNLHVMDMAATPELAKKYYKIARSGAKAEIAGLGDEACIDETNQIFVRKGLLNVKLQVNGDARDRVLWDDAAQRVNALAKLVAARLP
jgi:hypothetical protein